MRAGHQEAVDSLLQHGADARAEDFQGNNPAHLAAAKGHLAILALLLKVFKLVVISVGPAHAQCMQV